MCVRQEVRGALGVILEYLSASLLQQAHLRPPLPQAQPGCWQM